MRQAHLLRWGILSTANIAREKVIPAIQASRSSQVHAIASREEAHAQQCAKQLGIEQSYGSYEQLLADVNIDAIYNPLPNHLHVPWTLKAIAAGKHVLCEKPIGLSEKDAKQITEALKSAPNIKVMEAFMYRFHPQWQKAKQLIDESVIGGITHIDAHFSYFNDDPANVRNQANIGGGSLMDVGCYCISVARWLIGQQPKRVLGNLNIDKVFNVDIHATGMLDFGSATASFNCSMQSQPAQHVSVYGEQGMLTLATPFYQADGATTVLKLQQGDKITHHEFAPCNHYVEQIDAFTHAIAQQQLVPTALDDALANMQVIDAILQSNQQQQWVEL